MMSIVIVGVLVSFLASYKHEISLQLFCSESLLLLDIFRRPYMSRYGRHPQKHTSRRPID